MDKFSYFKKEGFLLSKPGIYLLFFIFSLILTLPVKAEKEEVKKSENKQAVQQDDKEYTSYERRRGQRLFMGMVPFGSGTFNCSSCHYTKPTDTLNWNPSAYELALLWKNSKNYSIQQILERPAGNKMAADHQNMIITPEEEHQLEAYFLNLSKQEPEKPKAPPINAFIFWGVGILMAAALIDLFFTKKIKSKILLVLIIIIGLGIHLRYARIEAQRVSRTTGYAPDQPIKFSHQIHSGQNQIECLYCHSIATRSRSAGIPSNNTCLNCHNVIREGTNSGRFEINKIHQAQNSGESVEWIRVHSLPDHSVFWHNQHVNAGNLECSKCHGDVEQMHIMKQVEPLSMGWCLTCHRDTDIDFSENPYYDRMFREIHLNLTEDQPDYVKVSNLSGQDCYVCHH